MHLHLVVSASYSLTTGLVPMIELDPAIDESSVEAAIFGHCCPRVHNSFRLPLHIFEANGVAPLLRCHGFDSVSVVFKRDAQNRRTPEAVKQRVVESFRNIFLTIQYVDSHEQPTPPKGTPDETPDCLEKGLAPQG